MCWKQRLNTLQTNRDTVELVINEVINKETLEKAEELMSISKGTDFFYRRYITLLALGWTSFFLTLLSSSRERGSILYRDGIFYANTISFEGCVIFLCEHSLMSFIIELL